MSQAIICQKDSPMRFVILEHFDSREIRHFDLLLEMDGPFAWMENRETSESRDSAGH